MPACLPACLTKFSWCRDWLIYHLQPLLLLWRLQVEKRLVASGSHLPSGLPEGGGSEEDEKELYCLCQQPYNVDTCGCYARIPRSMCMPRSLVVVVVTGWVGAVVACLPSQWTLQQWVAGWGWDLQEL